MFDELFPAARADSLTQQLQRPVVDPGDPGFWKGTGSAVADALPHAALTASSAWAAILDAYGHAAAYRDAGTVALMHGQPVATAAQIRGDTLDQMGDSETARSFRESARRYSPDPAAVGLAGQIAHGLISGAGKMVAYSAAGPAGPALFGADVGINRAQELTDQGVDGGTAAQAGLVSGTAAAAMMKIPPALGATRVQSAAIGGAVAPVLSVAEVGGIQALLERADYDKIAAQYHPFDPLNLSIAALTGAAFGGAYLWPSFLDFRTIGANFRNQLIEKSCVLAQVLLAIVPFYFTRFAQVFKHPERDLSGSETLFRACFQEVDDGLAQIQLRGHG